MDFSDNSYHISHKYLAQNPPTNEFLPASIDRIITKIMAYSDVPVVAPRPAPLIVAKSEPNVWAPWIDLTRSKEAYGTLCIPKLKKDLSSSHTMTVCQTLCTLTDLLHNPEIACQVLSLNLHSRLVKLLVNENPFIQQKTLMCITILANQPFGKEKLSKNKFLLNNIKSCIGHENPVIRNHAILATQALVNHSIGKKELIDAGFIKDILTFLNHCLENNDRGPCNEIEMVNMLNCLTSLIQNSDNGKIDAMAYDVFPLINLLSHPNQEIVNTTAEVFAEILKHKIGKLASIHWPFVDALTAHQRAEKLGNLRLLSPLRFATIIPENRKLAVSNGLIEVLVDTVNTTKHSEILLNIAQILTNLAEYPDGRKRLQEIGPKLVFSFDNSEVILKQTVLKLFDQINKPL